MISSGHGKQTEDEYQYAHTAGPVGKAPPDQHAPGKNFNVPQDTGSRGCKARDGFEQGVDQIGDASADEKGKTPHKAEHDPAQGDSHKPFPGIKGVFGGLFSEKKEADDQTAQDHGNKSKSLKFMVDQGSDGRQGHQTGGDLQDPAQDKDDDRIIHFRCP